MKNCRGQGYDNGVNMAGIHRGAQAIILEKNPQGIFSHVVHTVWIFMMYILQNLVQRWRAFLEIYKNDTTCSVPVLHLYYLDVLWFLVLFPTGQFGEHHPHQVKLCHSDHGYSTKIHVLEKTLSMSFSFSGKRKCVRSHQVSTTCWNWQEGQCMQSVHCYTVWTLVMNTLKQTCPQCFNLHKAVLVYKTEWVKVHDSYVGVHTLESVNSRSQCSRVCCIHTWYC